MTTAWDPPKPIMPARGWWGCENAPHCTTARFLPDQKQPADSESTPSCLIKLLRFRPNMHSDRQDTDTNHQYIQRDRHSCCGAGYQSGHQYCGPKNNGNATQYRPKSIASAAWFFCCILTHESRLSYSFAHLRG